MPAHLFSGREKRSFDRRQLYYYLKVVHSDTGRIAGYLGDISPQGLMVFSKETMDPQTIVSLTIDLSKEMGAGKSLTFDARSLWCEPDANPEYHIIGFVFIDLDQSRIDTVKYLTKKYGFDK